MHQACLSLGSNIAAEKNLPKAVQLLREIGKVTTVSTVWESESVGYTGPNFLNACVLFATHLQPIQLKEQVIRPIEAKLERIRSADKNAPRTIDIDIVLYDAQPLNMDFWDFAFVVVPLAQLIPGFEHPIRHEKLFVVASRLQIQVWIVPRTDVLIE